MENQEKQFLLTSHFYKMAEEKEQKVKIREDVTVFAVDKTQFVASGEPMTVHRIQAEKLVKDGKAVNTLGEVDAANEAWAEEKAKRETPKTAPAKTTAK